MAFCGLGYRKQYRSSSPAVIAADHRDADIDFSSMKSLRTSDDLIDYWLLVCSLRRL